MEDLDALLDRTRRGDPHAFEALVRAQINRLQAVAARVSGDRGRAEDIVQEVFLRVLTGRAPFRRRGSASGWLLRTTLHIALDDVRAVHARHRRERGYTMARSTRQEDRDRVVAEEEQTALTEAFRDLPEITQRCLWLRFADGLGVRQVAEAVGKSRSATAERIRRGVESLRAELRRRGFPLEAGVLPSLIAAPLVAPEGGEAMISRVLTAATATQAPQGAAPASHALAGATSRLSRAVRSSATLKAIAAAGAALVLAGFAVVWNVTSEDTDVNPAGTAPVAPQETPVAAAFPDAEGEGRSSEPTTVSTGEPANPAAAPPDSVMREEERFRSATLVVHSLDEAGEAVSNANVRLAAGSFANEEWSESFSTDMGGRLALDDVEPGLYYLRIWRYDRHEDGQDLVLRPGDDLELTYVLKPARHVTGHAYVGERELANVELELLQPVQICLDRVVHTDWEGRFVVGPFLTPDRTFFQLRHGDHRVVTVPSNPEAPQPEKVEVSFVPGVTAVGDVRTPGGRPVADVEVSWHRKDTPRNERLRAITDVKGRYELRGLAPAMYQVEVEGMGSNFYVDVFEETVLDFPVHKASFTVDCVPELEILALAPGGEPVPGVKLRYDAKFPHGAGSGELITDAEGSVRLVAVWSRSRISVAADDPGFESEGASLTVGEEAGPLVVRLRPRPRVRGRVLDQDGRAVAFLPVVCQYGEERLWPQYARGHWTRTDVSGRFEVPLVSPGPYRLAATAGERGVAWVLLEPAAVEDGHEVILRLDTSGVLRVRVFDQHGEPAEAVVWYRRIDAEQRDSTEKQARAGADGWCAVLVEPGEYVVRATYGNLESSEVEAGRPGDPPVAIELGIRERAPAVRGVVLHDGAPVANARVSFWDGSGPIYAGVEGATRTDSAGCFRIDSVFPEPGGTYCFYAWGPGFAVARSESVTLVEGETARVVLQSLPGEDFEALVVDTSGKPVPRATVRLQSEAPPPVRVEPVSDASGRVSVPRLPIGEYWYRVRSADETRELGGSLSWNPPPRSDGTSAPREPIVWTIADQR